MKKVILIFLYIVFTINSAFCIEYKNVEDIPDPKKSGTGYVSNPDSLISSTEQFVLDTMIANIESKTGIQCAVVILNSIGTNEPFDFGVKLFEHWGIGKNGKDNGLLLLISMEPISWRFHTGYGLESQLPDAILKTIGETYMIPEFRNGNFGKGIIDGINKVKDRLLNPDYTEPYLEQEHNFDFHKYYEEKAKYNIWMIFGLYAVFILIVFYFVFFRKKTETIKKFVIKKLNPLAWLFLYLFLPLANVIILNLFPNFYFEDIESTFIFLTYCWLFIIIVEKNVRKNVSIINSDLNLYEKHSQISGKNIFTSILLFIFPPAFIIYLAWAYIVRKRLRNAPRNCAKCNLPLKKLDEISDDKFLNSGQIKEETLGSRDYDVWRCENNHTEILTYSVIFGWKYTVCKYCGFKTLKFVKNRVITSPTYSSTGRGEKTYHCEYCNKETIKSYTIPKRTKSSSSGSGYSSSGSSWGGGGSSYSSGSSSWGGGHTGGGGAGGKW